MTRSKHGELQIIAALRQMEAGRRAEDVAREHGVSNHTITMVNNFVEKSLNSGWHQNHRLIVRRTGVI